MYRYLHRMCCTGYMDRKWIRFYEYIFGIIEDMV
jgi:hypothetical protein